MKFFKYSVLLAALSLFGVTQVTAHELAPSFSYKPGTHRVTGTVIEVIPVYSGHSTSTRYICENVDVPIYGYTNQGSAAGDVVAGMIIGGVMGKIVTGDDDGARAGAVIGGVAAASNHQRVIVGYRTERQCSNVQVGGSTILHYTNRIQLPGMVVRVNSSTPYHLGDHVYMYVHD